MARAFTKLFIANCTKQVQEIHYKIPENSKTFVQKINIGEQILVYREASREDLEAVVKQLSRYGLKDAKEAYKSKGFTGLCFSFDDPVKIDQILEVMEKNDNALDERSQEMRKNAAIATNNGIEEGLEQQGGKTKLKKLSQSIQEVEKPGQENLSFSENINVDKQG